MARMVITHPITTARVFIIEPIQPRYTSTDIPLEEMVCTYVRTARRKTSRQSSPRTRLKSPAILAQQKLYANPTRKALVRGLFALPVRRTWAVTHRIIVAELASERLEKCNYLTELAVGVSEGSQNIANELRIGDGVDILDIFYTACAWGHIHTLAWVVQYYNIAVDIVRSRGDLAMRLSRSGDHIVVIRWLTNRFRLVSVGTKKVRESPEDAVHALLAALAI